MTLEKQKLLHLIESLSDILLEVELGPQPRAELIRESADLDMKDPNFQRALLAGIALILKCEGIPAFITGSGVRLITSHINRIGMTFKISEKEGKAHAKSA